MFRTAKCWAFKGGDKWGWGTGPLQSVQCANVAREAQSSRDESGALSGR